MLGLLLMSLQVAAPAAGLAPAATTGQRTIQQDFEAAAQLQEAKNDAAAVTAWEALEKRIGANRRSHAIIRVRKAQALAALGRNDDAVAAARAGLADLPVSDASLSIDRYNAWITLAEIAEVELDYATASDAYRQAGDAAPDDFARVATFRGLIETETFLDPTAATRDLARIKAAIAPLKLDPQVRATLKRVESQLLLNQGDFAAAKTEAGNAIKLLGGLTSKTDLFDVAARSNYAIAALLNGNAQDARKYMAYTGAGRLPTGDFDPGVQMKVPDCGGEAGLKPDDFAVVQFSIGDDGSIINAAPVYAAGGGAVALEFARAVRDWSFDPVDVKKLPPFFRYRARVELRCSTAFVRPSIGRYLADELHNWLATKGVDLPAELKGSDAAGLPGLRARLAAFEAKNDLSSPELAGVLQLIATNAVVPREESNRLAQQALAILQVNNATPAAQLAVQAVVWATNSGNWSTRRYTKEVTPALSTPVFANDPAARNALRLLLADQARSFDASLSRNMLQQIRSDSALAANHPLRVGALVRLASLEQADGNVAAARTAFDDSGLSARQCALIDSPPRFLGIGNGGTFPQEAASWGFEGWTQVQFDIAADGAVINERAIVSYPPFIFTKAGKETFRSARFEKSFRPDGGIGCGGTSQRVRFLIPQ